MTFFKQQNNKPVLLVGLTIVFLITLSYLPKNLTVFGYHVKPVDLFMDIKPDSLLSSNSNNFIKSQATEQNTNQELKSDKYLASVNYNLLIDAINNQLKDNEDKANYNAYSNGPDIKFVNISGNTSQLHYFFDALKNAKNQKVRIAHYGDSEIEGDNVTESMREAFQEKFGGEGAGYLSITSQDITFRMTTKQSFSDNWKTYSILANSVTKVAPGISGFVAVPQGNSWVDYKTTGYTSDTKEFKTVRLFYGNATPSSIKYSFNNGSQKSGFLQSGKGVHEMTLKSSGNAKSIKISTSVPNQGSFYGVSLENGNGVYVDNFPLRGNTGVSLNDIPENVLSQFSKYLNYKLIILGFGLNVVGNSSMNYMWYEREMEKVVNHLKEAFPNCSILIVGVGDKSVKRGSRFITDPKVPRLIRTQERIAQKTGVAFWNLFEVMGGRNSMNDWVNANPPLAFKDYTHLTLDGTKKIGKLLAEALIDQYNSYAK